MKWTFYRMLLIAITMATVTNSCKKEYSYEGSPVGNRPPVAVAGADQVVALPLNNVLLDGSLSSDPDGNITEWHWTKIAGPASFNLLNPDSVKTSVTTLVQGIYQFELLVKDDKGATGKDTIQVQVGTATANNRPPVACAGADQTIILPVSTAMLDGTCSSDPDNNIVSYNWLQVSGPSQSNIATANLVQTPVNSLVEGTYVFAVKVTDAGGLFSTDTVEVKVMQPVDVYVAGMSIHKPVYWKNGQEVILPSNTVYNGRANAIAIVGTDVYAAGEEGDFLTPFSNRAMYWKNGQVVYLTGQTGAGAMSIAVAGNDVYVAGWDFEGGKSVARYWKNGQAVTLSNPIYEAVATGIVVVGADVYVSGYENDVAKYWKNGQPVSLTAAPNYGYANAIVVKGSDVYVAGEENGVAKYWKNGQPVALTNGTQPATAYSITVVGNDVYATGTEGTSNLIQARYWKNGQAVPFVNQSAYALALSIAVHRGDVYIAGYDSGPSFSARYWKNGQPVPLTPHNGSWATDIVVVDR